MHRATNTKLKYNRVKTPPDKSKEIHS